LAIATTFEPVYRDVGCWHCDFKEYGYKLYQQVIAASQAKEQQLAVIAQIATDVAHELRNPLTSVKMLVQSNREEAVARGTPAEDLRIIEQESGSVSGDGRHDVLPSHACPRRTAGGVPRQCRGCIGPSPRPDWTTRATRFRSVHRAKSTNGSVFLTRGSAVKFSL